MYRSAALVLPILAAAIVTQPVLADSRVRSADARVLETRAALVKAQRSHDVATIADAQARFQAATAVAWGIRHPAKQPTVASK